MDTTEAKAPETPPPTQVDHKAALDHALSNPDTSATDLTTADDYRVRLPSFEGPLDLLLHLIRKDQLNICDIPISRICKSYLSYLELLCQPDVNVAGEFFVMAATLTHIKSVMLLPQEARPEGEEDPRLPLVAQLLVYEAFKNAAKEIEKRSWLGRDVFARPEGATSDLFPVESLLDAPIEPIETYPLLLCLKAALNRTTRPPIHFSVDTVSLKQKVTSLSELMESEETIPFTRLIPKLHKVSDIVISFLSVLELARLKFIEILQSETYGPIQIRRVKSIKELNMGMLDQFQRRAMLDQDILSSALEALLFASEKPVSIERLKEVFAEHVITEEELTICIQGIADRYKTPSHGIELRTAQGGFHFVTKSSQSEWVRKFLAMKPFRLGRSAMETLAIIAYRQPVTRAEMDKVRGMDCSHLLRTLMERGLVKMVGKAEVPGRPVQYGTTPRFLEVIGLNSVGDLPPITELEQLQGSTDDPEKILEENLERFISDKSTLAEDTSDRDQEGVKEIEDLLLTVENADKEIFESPLHAEVGKENEAAMSGWLAFSKPQRKSKGQLEAMTEEVPEITPDNPETPPASEPPPDDPPPVAN